MIRTITGAYKSTNHQKLLEITGEVEIDIELNALNETSQIEKSTRKDQRKLLAEESRRQRSNFFDFTNLDFGRIARKETIWCLTGTGPFKYHLNRIGKVEDLDYRFCDQSDETSEHLFFECSTLNLEVTSETDTYEIKRISRELIKVLKRREQAILVKLDLI